jgi:hypothetical protein
MKSHWYALADTAIRRALNALPPMLILKPGDAEEVKAIIGRAVQTTMPHEKDGRRAYEHWHQARKDVLAERFPDMFPKHKKETDGRLF